jgi:predicted RNA-binding Zn ribbon-like protein
LRERWRRRVECLVTPADAVEWLRRAGLLHGEDPVPATDGALGAIRDLREAVDDLLRAAVAGIPAPSAAVALVDARMREFGPRPRFALVDGTPHLTLSHPGDPVDAAIGALAADAARVLGTPERSRLRICAAEDCSARFIDRSPAGRRRWCTMGGCGNRAKVRRHRRRAVTGS